MKYRCSNPRLEKLEKIQSFIFEKVKFNDDNKNTIKSKEKEKCFEIFDKFQSQFNRIACSERNDFNNAERREERLWI